jgi:hypothetical protein
MCPDIEELFAVIEEFRNALRNKCTTTPGTATDSLQELDDLFMAMEVGPDIIPLWQHFNDLFDTEKCWDQLSAAEHAHRENAQGQIAQVVRKTLTSANAVQT